MQVPMSSVGRAIAAAALLASIPAIGSAAPAPQRILVSSMPQTARIMRISLTNLSGAPHHQLLLQSIAFEPGAAVPPHVHPGDKTIKIEQGAITLVIGDDPPRVYREGDTVRIPSGVTNAAYNLTDEPARALEIIVVEKGEPLSTRVSARTSSGSYPSAYQGSYQPAPLSPAVRRRPTVTTSGYHPARDPDEGNFVREDER